mmetsp:Transcript_99885/g.161028  ORF Transcript_99885/g.161028 Transcript_99885/m.161028 type:complete len:153 (+) Transcript_99885:3-461(+)
MAEYAQAEALYVEGKFQEAILALGDDVETNSSSLFRRAKWSMDIGIRTDNAGEKEKILRGAVADATKASQVDPASFEAWRVMAVSKGRLQACCGVTEKLQLGKELRENIDRALELNPDDFASHTHAHTHTHTHTNIHTDGQCWGRGMLECQI